MSVTFSFTEMEVSTMDEDERIEERNAQDNTSEVVHYHLEGMFHRVPS